MLLTLNVSLVVEKYVLQPSSDLESEGMVLSGQDRHSRSRDDMRTNPVSIKNTPTPPMQPTRMCLRCRCKVRKASEGLSRHKQKLTEGDLPGEEADQSSEPEPSEEHEDDSRQYG